MINATDENGNSIYEAGNSIFLKLCDGRPSRNIGTINREERTFNVYRDYKKHLHIKTHSIGFNFDLLSNCPLFDSVVLTNQSKETFKIPVKVILDQGQFLFFKQQGFEKQIFLNLGIINQYKN